MPGVGLQGDRYALRIGHWSPNPGVGRDLTLIEAEVIEAADGQFYDVDALWHAVRRELERLIGPY